MSRSKPPSALRAKYGAPSKIAPPSTGVSSVSTLRKSPASIRLPSLVAVATLAPFSIYAGATPSIVVLIALLVCLIPTTIGGLLSAIGIAGMDRVLQRNVLATSGRAVEAAGDVDTLLLDKTGTITLGNRQATEIIVAPGLDSRSVFRSAYLSSLADQTPEGHSIVLLATPQAGVGAAEIDETTHVPPGACFVPFSAYTRMSGLDFADGSKVGMLVFPHQAGGSMIVQNGKPIGSAIIGQLFTKPQYFQGRPSAAGKNGYDPTSTGGTNLAPTSKKLIDATKATIAALKKANPDAPGAPPMDLVTSSGSGIDPDISPEGAYYQAPRVAKARNIPLTDVRAIVAAHITGRTFGILGEPRVNVLELNRALDARAHRAGQFDRARRRAREQVEASPMKLILELVLSAILHPIAVILMWLNLAGRTDLTRTKKILWAILGLVWGIGPILYILVGDGALW